MQWMDLRIIEEKIKQLHFKFLEEEVSKVDYFVQKKLFLEKLPLFMNRIKKYRQEGIKVLKDTDDVLQSMVTLLVIEAKIISIIECLVYENFGIDEEFSVDNLMKKNQPYVFSEYFEMVSYYADDFYRVSFLANYYKKYVKRD
ncbi:hypothetical protein [Enterococcus sp. C76]|uniref:hypothetical protein n=1 Tax=Enterococcus sp. C76 TaxID=3231334 RepID=UPI0034A0363D